MIRIGERVIGPGQPAYVIAEIGLNHNGNPELARKLVEVAVDCGCDAVKFQKRKLGSLYDEATLANLKDAEKELQYVVPFLQEFELSEETVSDLATLARQLGAEFLCTPWDIESVDFLEGLNVRAYKTASADLTNTFLIERLAQTGKPLMLSTGMSAWREIEATAALLKGLGVEFAFLHCRSTYPAPFRDLNLRFMERLREFGVPVGYSGHERGISVSICAAGLGASIIERHLTTDRSLPGPDHAASLEPQDFKKMVRDIRIVEEALGEPKRTLSRGELMNRHALGKSLIATRQIAAGTPVTREMVGAMGPGDGISPQRVGELLGRSLRRAVKAGEQFRESDLYERDLAEEIGSLPFRWGVVVRHRDFATLTERLRPAFVEFHLTPRELTRAPDELPGRHQQEVVLHCPEYVESRLVDLCATDAEHRRWSVGIVRQAADTVCRLATHFTETPERPKLVVHTGGASFEGFLADSAPLTEALHRSMDDLADVGAEVLLENLPPYPWYFGGQWYSNNFMRPDEIAAFCDERGLGITFDSSHAALWCNYANESLGEFIDIVRPFVRHVHLADATGLDGEGLQIGDGDVDWQMIVGKLADMEATIVPEIWLGHRHEGEGFAVALARLARICVEVGV